MRCLISFAILFSSSVRADEPKEIAFVKTTHTFKTVGDIKVVADVSRPDDATKRPAVVWIHGGALITGNRKSVPANIEQLCRKEGYVLVSIEYRLAPEVKIPAIIEDVEDAFKWLHERGPTLLNIDTQRIVVTGGSAGGYLTLMTGFRVKPRPTALVAYWGYGDVDGEWYTKPSEFYRKLPLIDKEIAYKGVGTTPIAGTDGSPGQQNRGRFYLYLRQNGLWTKEVTGFDPDTQRSKLDPFCPVRNVTPEYPPTLLVHGTEDTDVPYVLSANVAKELTRCKVPHELITVTGAGHGLSKGDKKLVDAAYQKSLAFIREKLNEK